MSELLQAGLNVTAIGMGVVFVLLTALVFIIQGMSALSLRLAGPPPAAGGQAPAGSRAGSPDHELVGVISAAIAAHRRRHQGTVRKRN